jgi:hypothetical protein
MSMILFLLTFLCLYGGINFYFFFRARSIFHFSGLLQALLLLAIIVLILAPILVRVLESFHWEGLARALACIGYVWMAFVFLFFFLSISTELVRIIHKFFVPDAARLALKAATFYLSVVAAAGLVIYGYFDAQHLRVRHLGLTTNHTLPNGGKLRIVQISDVHVGIIIRQNRLVELINKIRENSPDILVSTGDLLDGELDNVLHEAKHFASIEAPYGKYAVLGNHEYYAGLKRSVEFTKAAGFELLRDSITGSAGITIFGQDDITGRTTGDAKKREAFKNELCREREGFTLLLKHQPRVDEQAKFDLQLSGHTHGGQIFPFGLIVKLYFPKIYGLHRLTSGGLLYISRGTGTWGPPVRVFAPPEITVIDLKEKQVKM